MNQPPPYGYGNYAPPQQQQQQQGYGNPYAAPAPPMQAAGLYRQNVMVPYGASSEPLVGPTLRKWKLGLGITQIVCMVLGIALLIIGGAMDEPVIAGIGGIVFMVWYMLIFATAIVSGVWIYKFWSWIPPEQRWTNMWKKYISPGAAIGYMFIPYFNIYWMFVVYLGLSDIMERMRVQYPSTKGSPKTLAILAIVIPMVFFPAGPFLYYMLAKHLEEMAAEMQAQMHGAPNPMMARAA